MLFCAGGSIEISGIGFDPFPLRSYQLAVIPASTTINLEATSKTEIIRIEPVAV